MTWADFWAAVLPPVLTLLATIVTIGIAIATKWLSAKYHVEIEAKHFQTLNDVLIAGLNLALAKHGVTAATMPAAIKADVLGGAVKHAMQGAPDAIKQFGLWDFPEKIAEMAEARLHALASSAPIAITAGPAPTGA